MTSAERKAIAAVRGTMNETPKPRTRRGGPRPGAGAPLLDPVAGPRVMISARVSQDTVRRLQALVDEGIDESQGQAIDAAIERRAKGTGIG